MSNQFDQEWALGDEAAAWRERARAFAAEHVAPQAREADRAGRFDSALVAKLGAAGLIGTGLPADVGGGASALAACAVAEELGGAAKLYATEAALRASTAAIQMHGSRGHTDELPLERMHRDVIALTIHEGTSNIQRVILSRSILGKDEKGKS